MSARILPSLDASNDDEFDFRGLLEHIKSLKEIFHVQLDAISDPDELLYVAETLSDHPDYAVKFFRKAVSLRPDDLHLIVQVGYWVLAMGNAFCALELYRQALDIDPEDEGAYWLGIEVETAMLRDD